MARVNQSNAKADGDIVGRDKIIHHHYAHNVSPLDNLIAEFEQQLESDEVFSDLIDDLYHYTLPARGQVPLGLEKKLVSGDREDLVERAMREKEMFAKTNE